MIEMLCWGMVSGAEAVSIRPVLCGLRLEVGGKKNTARPVHRNLKASGAARMNLYVNIKANRRISNNEY